MLCYPCVLLLSQPTINQTNTMTDYQSSLAVLNEAINLFKAGQLPKKDFEKLIKQAEDLTKKDYLLDSFL